MQKLKQIVAHMHVHRCDIHVGNSIAVLSSRHAFSVALDELSGLQCQSCLKHSWQVCLPTNVRLGVYLTQMIAVGLILWMCLI